MKAQLKEQYREDNMIDLQAGYDYLGENCPIDYQIVDFSAKIGDEKKLMFGNELLTEGAIASGL
jgi:hypothetical protein